MIEVVKPLWVELTTFEQQLAVKVADVTGQKESLIDQLRAEGMTANMIAVALDVDVADIRRRMVRVVKVPSTKTQPLQ